MKKFFIILVTTLLIGGVMVILPYFHNDKKTQKIAEEKREKQIQDISSTPKTTKIAEILEEEREPEQYDREQMYFENIESLYMYFKFQQVEDIKQRVQYYIHKNINKDILDCSLKTNTIKEYNGLITFELLMEDVSYFEVQITKDKENRIIDVTIVNSILKE